MRVTRRNIRNSRQHWAKKLPCEILLYRPNEKVHNYRWVFHRYDDDYFPSVPHGHSVDCKRQLKLDVNNGGIYNSATRALVGHASKKELSRLQQKRDFQQFTIEHLSWYRDKYPNRKIEQPEWLPELAINHHVLQTRKRVKLFVAKISVILDVD